MREWFRNVFVAVSTVGHGMWVTLRYWFKTYDPQRKTFTEHFEYPELPVPVANRYRGFHRYDLTTCIACDQCARACPVDCIYIGKERVQGSKGFKVTGFTIDYTKCMFRAPRWSMSESAGPRKLFTVDEANAMLPLVRAIAGDFARLTRDVVERRERLASLRAGRHPKRSDAYSEELSQIEEELEKDCHQLQEYVEELRQLGVEPKGGLDGLVDFPALMDGREVYLCWRLGEPEILFWHDIHAGFAGRQPLTAGAVAGSDEDSDDAAT
jgi:hypothetical protein